MPQSHNHSGTSADRRSGWALLALIALALVLRIIAVLLIGPPAEIVGYSESGLVAGNLARGAGYTYDFFGLRPAAPLQAFMPPLYVWLIYACLKLGAPASLLLALAQSALSAATCVAIYLLAEVLSSNRRVAWLSALAAACYPVMILMVTVPASLTLHLAVLAWALAFTARIARRTSTAEAVAAGLCWGLLGLGRPTMLLFVPFVVLWLMWHRSGGRDRRYPWLPAGGLLLLTTFLTVLPWTVRNGVVLGQFVPVSTNGGFVFWNGNNPFTTGSGHEVYTAKADAYLGRSHDPSQPVVVQAFPYPLPHDIQSQVSRLSETELSQRLQAAGLDYIRQQPGDWLALVGRKLVGSWWFRDHLGAAYEASWTRTYRPIYALLLAMLGIGLIISPPRWRHYSLLYLLFVFYTLSNLAFHVQTRYRWEVEPLFLIFAALATVTLAARTRWGRRFGDSGRAAV